MENRFEHTPPEEEQGWGAYATPPSYTSKPARGGGDAKPPPYPGPLYQTSTPEGLPQEQGLCARVRMLLPHLIENDGEVRPEMAKAVYGHLAVCPDCAQQFNEMQHVVAMLNAMAPAEMPMDFSGVIMRRLQSPNGPVLHGASPRPTLAASSPVSGEAASRTTTSQQASGRTTVGTGYDVVQTQTHRQTLGTQSRQETVTTTGATTMQRLTLAGVLSAVLAFFLSSSLGRQILGVNLEAARVWLEQISAMLERVPLLGQMVAFIFAVLAQIGNLLDATYTNLGTMAVRGLVLDAALCAAAYYFLTRRQRGQIRGI